MTRRIVTGKNAEGKSYFVHDGPSPTRLNMGMVINEQIWIDDPAKPDPMAAKDPVDVEKIHLHPPLNGSSFRVVTFFPEGHAPEISHEELAKNRSRADDGGVFEADNPGMHTTRTIDYAIVLSGEIYLKLDEGEMLLQAGDIVVQRATRHGWYNRGDEPCPVAFVLISSPNYI
ncbi:MAG: cupin domain-containing protein [Dehalococcoidia bacterium]